MSFTDSLPKDCVLDRLRAMIIQEDTHYAYESYFPNTSWEEMELQAQLNASWREKICQWSYNVVDHFDLPREVVAISLDLFDRYLATRGNQCSGNMALLASLTTLHIAIKVHSEKNIKVSTLASLSRGQFGAEHIEQMEWRLMNALGWKLHPPTLFAFVSHLLMVFPSDVHHSVRKELFEVAIYMAELSVCDSFFVKYPASTVAIAAIINVMEDLPLSRLSPRSRDEFWATLSHHVSGFHPADIAAARDRLRAMFAASSPCNTQPSNSTYYEPSVTNSPTSTTEMQLDEAASIATTSSSSNFIKSKATTNNNSNNNTSTDQFRYSPSPTPSSQRMMAAASASASPMSYCTSRTSTRIASSPIVADMQ